MGNKSFFFILIKMSLILAVKTNNIEKVKKLLKYKNSDEIISQAIQIANERGYTEIVQMLLSEKIKPSYDDDNDTEDETEKIKPSDDDDNDTKDENEKIKIFAITFFMQDDKLPIAEIRKRYKAENQTTLSNEFIDTVIRHSLRQYKQENLSAMDHMAIITNLEKSMSRFDQSGWSRGNKLGEGAYGSVCKIQNDQTTLALKTFKGELRLDIIRELGCYALLTAANTRYSPKIHGMSIEPDTINITLDLANGTLKDFSKTVNYGQRIKLFSQVSDMAIKAVAEFHSCGLIHADIKPANMLAWWDGENLCKLVLADFGLSSSRPDIDGQVYTEPYRAPELFLNEKVYANRDTDVYALGKTLQEFLIKTTDTDDEKSLPVGSEIILQMTQRDPSKRLKLDEFIFTFPKRKWSMGNFDIDEITVELNKLKQECQIKDFSKATFLQACDITFRHLIKDPARIKWAAALIIASNWGEQENLIVTKKKSPSIIGIIQTFNGLVYLPGLEYLENKSWDNIYSEIKRLLSS